MYVCIDFNAVKIVVVLAHCNMASVVRTCVSGEGDRGMNVAVNL